MQIYKKLSNNPEYLIDYKKSLHKENIDIKTVYLSDVSKNYLLLMNQYNNSIKSLFYCLTKKL